MISDKKIGEVDKVKDNKIAKVKWKKLSAGKEYGWYVIVGDDFKGKARSNIWTFTTEKQKVNPSSGSNGGGLNHTG
jgi:hypothetical protein